MINTCDCHKASRLIAGFYAPILKLGYTQLGNHLETDLSTLGWKRESHPSGNSSSCIRYLWVEPRACSGGGDLWCHVPSSTPPAYVIHCKVQLKLHRNSPQDGLMDGTACLRGRTAFIAEPWIMRLWHEHKMLKASRRASGRVVLRAQKVQTHRNYTCAAWLVRLLFKKYTLLTGWCMICLG